MEITNDLQGIKGIYCIKNELNSKLYIGQSVDIYIRLKQHHNLYSKDIKNSHLYNAMQKYGVHNFTVSILEIVEDAENLNVIEAKWITEFDTCNRKKGYNTRIEQGDTYSHSEETKLKISEARKGYVMPKEHKDKLQHTFYSDGHIVSKEVLAKRAEGLRQAWKSGKFDHVDYTKPNAGHFTKGQVSHMKGKTTSDETKAKQSAAKKGKGWTEAQRLGRLNTSKKTNKELYQFTLNNRLVAEYEKAKDVEIATDREYRMAGVNKCCLSKSNYYKDYIFKYKSDVILIEKNGYTTFIYLDGTEPRMQFKTRATRTNTNYQCKNW